MKNIFFLSPVFKVIGAVLLVLSAAGLLYLFFSNESAIFGVFLNEKIILSLLLISLFLLIFSKDKKESPQLYEIRARSLFLAVLINLVCSFVLVASLSMAESMWVHYVNLFSLYVLYVVIYFIGRMKLPKTEK